MTTSSVRRDRHVAASPTGGALLAVAVLLVAINLRGPIVAVAPVVGAIRADLGVSAAVAGLLTSLPVLAFAVASSPASWLIGRIGPERAVLVGLAVLGAGTLLRSSDGVAGALGGTVLIGVGITVGNVVVPVVIGRDFPHRSGPLLGAYTAVMNIGSMITLSITVPLADDVGWRIALLAWVVVMLAAAALWVVAVRRRTPTHDEAAAGRNGSSTSGEGDERAVRPLPLAAHTTAVETAPWRRRVGWLLVAAFAGQSFSYYGLTAWLPEILADLRGLGPASAGVASSLFQNLRGRRGARRPAGARPHRQPARGVRPGGAGLAGPALRAADRPGGLAALVRPRRDGPGRRLLRVLLRRPRRVPLHRR